MARFYRAVGLFWATVVTGTGVVGAYLGAAAVNLEWQFYLVVAIGILVGGGFLIVKPTVTAIAKIQKYGQVVESLGKAQQTITRLQSEKDIAAKAAREGREEGIREGEDRVRGAILATFADPPTIRGIAAYEGQVAFVCDGAPMPPSGARFEVRSATTESLRGIVQLVDIAVEPDSPDFLLVCIDATNEQFWSALSGRMDEDDGPPSNVELRVPEEILSGMIEVASQGAPAGLQQEGDENA